ncbi:hypothetical protein [Halorubellus sp. PRR65]|nr:hypothetical protein [Halorubellus sp. PRR65]
MPVNAVVLATVSILAALAFLEAVAYLDDGTTLCGLLYSRLTAQTDC